MQRPTATFVIPCFNHGRFVAKAVESALGQIDADTHVVVVDDGSTDGTTPAACDGCAGDRVTVIHQPNTGLPGARNRGAREARGEYLVFLDADDFVAPRFVAKLHRAIQAEAKGGRGEDVSHAYCQERLVGLGRGIWRVPDWDPMLLMITNLHPVTTLVRRDRFEAVGGFDEAMTGGYEDWDLWLKFAERGWRGVRVREPLFVWRRHSRTTMVMQVIHNHEALYRRIMSNHAAFYRRHAGELLVRANVMMRRFDVNWLDESGEPISLRHLRSVRETYESMAGVRLQRSVQRALNALPRPLGRGARRLLAGALRGVAPARTPSASATPPAPSGAASG